MRAGTAETVIDFRINPIQNMNCKDQSVIIDEMKTSQTKTSLYDCDTDIN